MENIYTNEYLDTLLPAWNEGLRQEDALSVLPLQRDFYNANLRYTKERTVVIISDAMRYEVGQELFARMQDDPKCSAQLNVQLGVLPSYTRLGMAALLPHRTLEMTDDFQVWWMAPSAIRWQGVSRCCKAMCRTVSVSSLTRSRA